MCKRVRSPERGVSGFAGHQHGRLGNSYHHTLFRFAGGSSHGLRKLLKDSLGIAPTGFTSISRRLKQGTGLERQHLRVTRMDLPDGRSAGKACDLFHHSVRLSRRQGRSKVVDRIKILPSFLQNPQSHSALGAGWFLIDVNFCFILVSATEIRRNRNCQKPNMVSRLGREAKGRQ